MLELLVQQGGVQAGGLQIALEVEHAALRYLLRMDERLEALLDLLDGSIIGPDIGLEAETCFHVYFVLVIEQHHTLSNIATCVLEPLLAEFGDVDQDRAHLTCFHSEHRHPIAMNALDLNHTERPFVIWPK